MKLFERLWVALLVAVTVTAIVPAQAANSENAYQVSDSEFKGFVTVRPGRELYVDVVKAQPGKPTAVLLNGLTYSTQQWNDFVADLIKQGFGVLRYDMYGMGQSLIMKSGPIYSAITLEDQIADLKALLDVIHIKGPYNLVGLSYGGAIAMNFAKTYPNLVQNLVLLAPFTRPVSSQDQWIRSQIWLTRQTNPNLPYSDDDLYDFYLRQIIYSTYPSVEPIILSHPFKLDAVYRLVQGARKFMAVEIVDKFPTASVHLVISARDQYIDGSILTDFWNQVPAKSRASLLTINDAEHKIPQHVPNFSAGWVAQIIMNDKKLRQGLDFIGDPRTGAVFQNGEKVYDLPKGFKHGYL